MLIYGSQMYFKSNVVRSFGECEHCGRFGKQVSYRARKFGHLYFIPLIPMGPKSQVLRECKSCKMGAHIPESNLGPLVESLSDRFKSWVSAISEGETEWQPEPDEPPINLGALIAGSLDDLYCLNEVENVDAVVDLLDASQMQMEKELVQGRWSELQGDLDSARSHYQSANRLEPESEYPLYQLGLVELKRGDISAAEHAFSSYQRLCPDDLSPYLQLAGAYEATKNYPKIVETYDVLYEAIPHAREDKKMKKVYKRACKKSGIEGKFLK